MKKESFVDHGITIDPKVVHGYTQASRKREPRTDDCLSTGSGELWEEYKKREPPKWLGCTAVLPNGKRCFNIPLYGDKCFVHSLSF